LDPETTLHHIAALTHGRYLLRLPSGTPRGLIVGFHGYAETAEDHLAALLEIPGARDWVLCSVQGLHPFYRGRTGEVVAGWMTRLDRQLAIDDNVRYVASVTARLRREHPQGPLVFAGFSQGVAMAYRAAAGSGVPSQGLIALAADVPPDVAERDLSGFPQVLLGRGTDDEWYSEEKMSRDLAALERRGVPHESCVFAGGHEWHPEFLARAGDFLARLASSPE
jgi:predicted esterase